MPIVHRLEDKYSDQIEFVWLNIDDASTLPMRQQYDIVRRSQYALVAPDGQPVRKWFGYLSEDEVAQALDEYLAGL